MAACSSLERQHTFPAEAAGGGHAERWWQVQREVVGHRPEQAHVGQQVLQVWSKRRPHAWVALKQPAMTQSMICVATQAVACKNLITKACSTLGTKASQSGAVPCLLLLPLPLCPPSDTPPRRRGPDRGSLLQHVHHVPSQVRLVCLQAQTQRSHKLWHRFHDEGGPSVKEDLGGDGCKVAVRFMALPQPCIHYDCASGNPYRRTSGQLLVSNDHTSDLAMTYMLWLSIQLQMSSQQPR